MPPRDMTDTNLTVSDMSGNLMRCRMANGYRGPVSNSGLIVGETATCWVVQWNGIEGSRHFHKSFIEIVGPVTTNPQ